MNGQRVLRWIMHSIPAVDAFDCLPRGILNNRARRENTESAGTVYITSRPRGHSRDTLDKIEQGKIDLFEKKDLSVRCNAIIDQVAVTFDTSTATGLNTWPAARRGKKPAIYILIEQTKPNDLSRAGRTYILVAGQRNPATKIESNEANRSATIYDPR